MTIILIFIDHHLPQTVVLMAREHKDYDHQFIMITFSNRFLRTPLFGTFLRVLIFIIIKLSKSHLPTESSASSWLHLWHIPPGHDDKGDEDKSYDDASDRIENSHQTAALSHLHQLLEKFIRNASSAFKRPNSQPMQVAPPGGQNWN